MRVPILCPEFEDYHRISRILGLDISWDLYKVKTFIGPCYSQGGNSWVVGSIEDAFFKCYEGSITAQQWLLENKDKTERVPIGIEPMYIWKSKRLHNLKAAMDRYTQANLPLNQDWIDEYNLLVSEIKR